MADSKLKGYKITCDATGIWKLWECYSEELAQDKLVAAYFTEANAITAMQNIVTSKRGKRIIHSKHYSVDGKETRNL